MNKKLLLDETILKGQWIIKDGKILEDDVTKKIKFLIGYVLKKISDSKDGWSQLYIDPEDNRYWELTYPDSDSQGGGAPQLACISRKEAITKYQFF